MGVMEVTEPQSRHIAGETIRGSIEEFPPEAPSGAGEIDASPPILSSRPEGAAFQSGRNARARGSAQRKRGNCRSTELRRRLTHISRAPSSSKKSRPLRGREQVGCVSIIEVDSRVPFFQSETLMLGQGTSQRM